MPETGDTAAPEGVEQDQTAVQQESVDSEAPEGLGDAGKQALDRMKAERNEATRALKAAQRELEQTRKASMTESEKAVAEAEERGRAAAATEFGKRLVRSDIRAAALEAGKALADSQIDYLDLTRFLGEDGEPDTKAIGKFVADLQDKPPAPPPSYDGGPRPSPPAAPDMNTFLRRATGRA